MPMNYNASAITDNKTLLEKLHEIEKHLEENPLYKVYYATTSYMVGTTTYDKSFLLAKDQDTIGEGDVVFFNNKYYALVLSANDKQFFTAPAISLGEEGGTESKQITELEFTNVLNLFFDNIDGAKINYYGKTKYADGTETPNAMELQIPIKAGDDIIIDATEDNEHIEVKVDTTSLFVKLPSQALDIYPIGSIYTSVESTSPAELFGGTWTQIKDRFILACGDTYTNGAMGGASTHTLTVNEMPSHSHTENITYYSTSSGIGWDQQMIAYTSATSTASGVYPKTAFATETNQANRTAVRTGANGSGQAHNNMPPYLAVYMWKRTA